jgi:hypothetical protein
MDRLAALPDFISMIMKMKPELKVDPRFVGLLTDLLKIAMTREDFEVNTEEVVKVFQAHGIHKRESNLKRHILPLENGRDFIQTTICPVTGSHKLCRDLPPKLLRGGYYKKFTWLTIDAFLYLCLHMNCPVSRQLQEYFILAERLYRNNTINHIQVRQVFENPVITAAKRRRVYPRFPKGWCVYIISLYNEHGVRVHLKEGWSADMNERLPELDQAYYPFLVIVEFHMLTKNNPWAIEACGLNSTPDTFRCGLDREIVDGNLERAIKSLIDCDRFMTTQKQLNTKAMVHLTNSPISQTPRLYRSPSLDV